MTYLHRTLLASALLLLAAPLINAQATESSINKEIKAFSALPEAQRPAAIQKAVADLSTFPAGPKKVKLADTLAKAAEEGDNGQDALQVVTDTLAKTLAESPVPAKGDQPPTPYMDLADLVRYEKVTAKLEDPLYVKAGQIVLANEGEMVKADFTLKDLKGKKVTLSELRGKIVILYFFTTTCETCLKEMQDLNFIDANQNYKSQGLVILAITDEDPFKVNNRIAEWGFHPAVLIDDGGKAHKLFHVQGIPRSIVLNREGKLAAVGINGRTQLQFLKMAGRGGLHP
jgi:peroxiredoxin